MKHHDAGSPAGLVAPRARQGPERILHVLLCPCQSFSLSAPLGGALRTRPLRMKLSERTSDAGNAQKNRRAPPARRFAPQLPGAHCRSYDSRASHYAAALIPRARTTSTTACRQRWRSTSALSSIECPSPSKRGAVGSSKGQRRDTVHRSFQVCRAPRRVLTCTRAPFAWRSTTKNDELGSKSSWKRP